MKKNNWTCTIVLCVASFIMLTIFIINIIKNNNDESTTTIIPTVVASQSTEETNTSAVAGVNENGYFVDEYGRVIMYTTNELDLNNNSIAPKKEYTVTQEEIFQ